MSRNFSMWPLGFNLSSDGLGNNGAVIKSASMKNLLDCHGRHFTATIRGKKGITGKVSVEFGTAYLCQNEREGVDCVDKLGYSYSWSVKNGSKSQLIDNEVEDFHLTDTPDIAERYFLMAYSFPKGTGNLSFTCPSAFPRWKEVKESCAKLCGAQPSEIVITNIFEFKSKEDYDSFNS